MKNRNSIASSMKLLKSRDDKRLITFPLPHSMCSIWSAVFREIVLILCASMEVIHNYSGLVVGLMCPMFPFLALTPHVLGVEVIVPIAKGFVQHPRRDTWCKI